MNSIRFNNVRKSFGKTDIIKGLDMEIVKGERLILLGPSGCGKSTILRMISGLESITSGELYLNDELANDIDSGDRNIAMVFQNYALYPHMTINENVGYGLKVNKMPRAEVDQRVSEALEVLDLTGLEGRYPRELSGGQRQRVALARALVKRAEFFLLDEPLSNLDAQLRGHARKELVKIHDLYQQTFVYVTHDQVEAMTIGHRIALLNGGVIQMLDTPHNVYHRPANIFVATFIGSPSMNIIDCKLNGNELVFKNGRIKLPDIWLNVLARSDTQKLKLGVRPEDILLSDTQGEISIPVEIRYMEDYGNRVGFYFDLNGEEVISIMNEKTFATDKPVYWNANPEKLHFFDGDTTNNIGYPQGL